MNIENELAAKMGERMNTQLSADEELDAVREMESMAREDADPRIEPTLDLNDVESLFDRAFENANDDSADQTGMDSALSDDDLLDSASFGDDDLSDDVKPGAEPDATEDQAESAPAQEESLMKQLGESFGDESKVGRKGPGAADDVPGLSLNSKDASINAALDTAKTQLGNDTDESIKRAMAAQGGQASPQGQQVQRAQFGIIQGMSFLGGAGLMALGNMVKAGGASISNGVANHKYQRLSGEIDTLTNSMDSILTKFDSAGFSSGIKGLKDEHKAEFVKEFMSKPENKLQLDSLVQSVGNLSTKAEQALVTGAAAGLSADQLDVEVNRKIKNLNDQHKQILDSLQDHNGKKLSDRLDSMINKIGEMLQQLFRAVADTLGFNQRPGM